MFHLKMQMKLTDFLVARAKITLRVITTMANPMCMNRMRESPLKKIASPEKNALFEIGRAIYFLMKVNDCDGFHQAIQRDLENSPKNIRISNYSSTFADIWAAYTLPAYYKNETIRTMPETSEWVALNTPSAKNGFAFLPDYIDKYDLAGNTPLHNLAPIILPDELDVMASRGADLFKPQANSNRTAFDILAARPDAFLFRFIVPEIKAALIYASPQPAGSPSLQMD